MNKSMIIFCLEAKNSSNMLVSKDNILYETEVISLSALLDILLIPLSFLM